MNPFDINPSAVRPSALTLYAAASNGVKAPRPVATDQAVGTKARRDAIAASNRFGTALAPNVCVRPLSSEEDQFLASRRAQERQGAAAFAAEYGDDADSDSEPEVDADYPEQAVCDEVIDRLYEETRRLAYQWRVSGVRGCLDSRMVAAALRRLDREGWVLAPRGIRERANLEAEALRVLRLSWRRAAKRDFAREQESRSQGNRPALRSLEEMTERTGDCRHPVATAAAGGDPYDAVLRKEILRLAHQPRFGLSPAQARAWELRHFEDLDWNEVSERLTAETGQAVTSAQVRQWASRKYPRFAARLAAEVLGDQNFGVAANAPRSRHEVAVSSSDNFAGTPTSPEADAALTRIGGTNRFAVVHR